MNFKAHPLGITPGLKTSLFDGPIIFVFFLPVSDHGWGCAWIQRKCLESSNSSHSPNQNSPSLLNMIWRNAWTLIICGGRCVRMVMQRAIGIPDLRGLTLLAQSCTAACWHHPSYWRCQPDRHLHSHQSQIAGFTNTVCVLWARHLLHLCEDGSLAPHRMLNLFTHSMHVVTVAALSQNGVGPSPSINHIDYDMAVTYSFDTPVAMYVTCHGSFLHDCMWRLCNCRSVILWLMLWSVTHK